MAGSSTFSSTWMLSLLLVSLFITFLHSAKLHPEFDTDLKNFGKSVEKCSNCSSTLIECQCLNYSVSTADCGFPGYFTTALKSLHSSIYDTQAVHCLIAGLETIPGKILEDTSFCSQSANLIISPKCLYEQLKRVRSYINNMSDNKILVTNASVAVRVEC